MATEMGNYYDAMTRDMGGKLSGYMQNLQGRYGDPRVYEAQRQQMLQQDNHVRHAQSVKTADLLRTAYDQKSSKNRASHDTRIKKRVKVKPPPEASPP